MALIADVKAVLDRLAPRGWAALFSRHGLDITVSSSALAAELARPLTIDFTVPGFEELALDSVRAIEAGVPGRSLLYHALASADVSPGTSASANDFPTLDEIDTIENYVYATANRKLSSFANPVIAVVSYQYRPMHLSVHRNHADVAYARTGVSRVGTEAARYDASLRTFDPRPVDGDRGFAVTPARFAAFIAELRMPGPDDSILRTVAIDNSLPFVFPVHKLFAGRECLFADDGSPINLTGFTFVETHFNEKLRRIHLAGPDNPGRVAPMSQFNINKPPFVRTTADSGDLVKLQKVGASVLTVPMKGPIVRTVTQAVAGGASELVRFKVPRANSDNRFWSSLQLSATSNGRAAPEYANIRQIVTRSGDSFSIEDLNVRPNAGTPAAEQFDRKLDSGGYEAAHFVDGTCDGAVSVKVPAALSALRVLPAYSLVSAVDYFPGVEQVEIEEWVERVNNTPMGLGDSTFQFSQGGPKPLSDGRFVNPGTGMIVPARRIPNINLNDPAAVTPGTKAFPATQAVNQTTTALVGRKSTAAASMPLASARFGSSWLPDSASDVFAPGWDISHNVVGGQGFYASHGLGSPFPEDAKLCAALNSFWPAAAPDSSRTYGFFADSATLLPTGIPLTDREVGYHPDHPRVAAGEVASHMGWDGDFGPFLETVGGARFVNASDVHRADQTRAALDGKLGFSGLDEITSAEMILRMEELRFVRAKVLAPNGFPNVWLVAVERVLAWANWLSTVWPRMNTALTGDGLIYTFAQVNSTPQPVGDPPLRSHYAVIKTIQIQLAKTVVFFRIDNGSVQRINR